MLNTKMRYYKLTYSQGTHISDKIFEFEGGLKDAIKRGRTHCEIMGYRFIMVRPGIVNLLHQEDLKLSNADWHEGLQEPERQPVTEVVKVK